MSTDAVALIQTLGQQARASARQIAWAPSGVKSDALRDMARRIREAKHAIQSANALDIEAGRKKGLSEAMLDRLTLTDARIEAMAVGVEQIAALPDPVGEMGEVRRRPNGLMIGKMRVPVGVIGMIYESRPNVTADAAALCLKSGNAVILRGGSEAIRSNRAIHALLVEGLRAFDLPEEAIQLVPITDRLAVGALLKADRYVDIIIPRGGKSLVARVSEESTIPVIKHLDGICHTYIDRYANRAMALEVAVNAKVQRPGTCNATETILVHEALSEWLLELTDVLIQTGVEIRGCDKAVALDPRLKVADRKDWDTEHLGLIVNLKVVGDLDEALDHIEAHSSRHTEAIITDHHGRAMRFLREVDSASVMVNASTRFADGFEYGLGAEIGISTDKLHARGPVGAFELTTLKWVVFGEGQVRG
ncbi:MAG: glutamate-5-semialdehyde dehydrogenase [Alphaproteobacteria bacterium CG_4_10_14_0_2_um_filter_63_37]|nr:MAG: glutamate-5-semialdehyde dehydrogenase [Proteobacteria bacterium CG1_02_64_396]PJA25457.1 MAG: glutamate-5-semialdehyde dehydrogenase [Alphaproteobacteria bacterium CG_4_10_14_0_2_um_filter_63_37]